MKLREAITRLKQLRFSEGHGFDMLDVAMRAELKNSRLSALVEKQAEEINFCREVINNADCFLDLDANFGVETKLDVAIENLAEFDRKKTTKHD